MKKLRLPPFLLAVLLAAAAGLRAAPEDKPADKHKDHDHHHASGDVHKPLMGGQLVEIGEHQFNLELKYDGERGVLQAWILDAHAENFVRVPFLTFAIQEEEGQKRVITLKAIGSEISGETPGDSSSFEGEARWLGEIEHFDGIVPAITIRGAEFRDVDFHFHPKG